VSHNDIRQEPISSPGMICAASYFRVSTGKHEARVLGSREALLKALAIASETKLAKAGFGGSGEPDDHYAFPLTL